MFSPRPAYPRGFYLFGALVAGVLVIKSALTPAPSRWTPAYMRGWPRLLKFRLWS